MDSKKATTNNALIVFMILVLNISNRELMLCALEKFKALDLIEC
jgi:hypothetical protein